MGERLRRCADLYHAVTSARSLGAGSALTPPAVRGFLLRSHRGRASTSLRSAHPTVFGWSYAGDQPEIAQLYARGSTSQWVSALDLPWDIDVDPDDPERPVLPPRFFNFERARELGIRLDAAERRRLERSLAIWMLSQFLHGEQGALYAAGQLVGAVPFFDSKLFGATQVVDEARHVETFQRYLNEKLGAIYEVNDHLYVALDALLSDPRWDVKYMGMQLVIEGMALSAFSSIYKRTREPLLRALLRRVLEDESRHVKYGLATLGQHVGELSDAERRDRERWIFQIAHLMRDRFYAYEIYDEWFAPIITRTQWRDLLNVSPGPVEFRRVMYQRLKRQLRSVGLFSRKLEGDFDRVGL